MTNAYKTSLPNFIASRNWKPFDEANVASMIKLIARGVKSLHDTNIMHRDLRIGAIQVSEHSSNKITLKINDFNLALRTSSKVV